MEFGKLVRLYDVMNLIHILSHPFNIQGREPYLPEFVGGKTFNIGWYSDIYRPISFKLGMIVETTKLYVLI